ncbi:PREDICTED: uncharacterized protein LOC104818102 [Tarenaya hassleriana]|uniref:uncharacterized protein LOC104818102 n=1 Tax=Tarenaya hassleriana TaxID=28532 RepID=UPI00053C98DF|nr:PREDICTED: uncharacterized protein LOC104818102 [Tarenaya hassleriana]
MGYTKKAEEGNSRSSLSSSSLNEALLFATMCIVGLQVHVHVKDGSVYSGIFYTASVENGFGVVLKNAKLTKKGTSKSNVASGSVVETLVILSSNIVQIIAEGVSLPSTIEGNTVGENVEFAMAAVPSEPLTCDANKPAKSGKDGKGINHRSRFRNDTEAEHGRRNGFGAPKSKYHQSSLIQQRQGMHKLEHDEPTVDFHKEDNMDVQSSSSSFDSTSERVKPIEEDTMTLELHTTGPCHDAASERPPSTGNSSVHSTTTDETSELYQSSVPSSNGSVPMQATDPIKKPKEFKLNPGAKDFSPSFTKGLSPIPARSGAYIPSNAMFPVPEPLQPEVGISPFIHHATLPAKSAPYSNLTAANAGSGSLIPQPMLGPTGNRAQPLRFTSQYHPVQAAPMLANPNPQVMVNRLGQLVYVQPVSPDLVQGTLALAPLPSRPVLTAQQVQYPKHQGVVAGGQPSFPICLPQPFVANGPQPFSGVPPQFQVLQPPFTVNHPITVPTPNGFLNTKFP